MPAVLERASSGRAKCRGCNQPIARDQGLADCHYNLSLLYQKLKKPREALRHMAQYRRLMTRIPK